MLRETETSADLVRARASMHRASQTKSLLSYAPNVSAQVLLLPEVDSTKARAVSFGLADHFDVKVLQVYARLACECCGAAMAYSTVVP